MGLVGGAVRGDVVEATTAGALDDSAMLRTSPRAANEPRISERE